MSRGTDSHDLARPPQAAHLTLYAIPVDTLILLVASIEDYGLSVLAAADKAAGWSAVLDAFLRAAESHGAMLWEAGELTTVLDRDLLPPSKVEEGLRRALSSDDNLLAAFREDDNGQSEDSVATRAFAFFTFSLLVGSRIGSEPFRAAMARFGDEDERDDATADSQPDPDSGGGLG